MDADQATRRAASFGSVANAYADFRPSYPPEAVAWLAGARPGTVLELGSGTGKLTAPLTALGHRVIATDPSPQMLAELAATAPAAHRVVARAERIPVRGRAVDVVACAQAYHWFDPAQALPEIARVLRPGGTMALVWNGADTRVPWVRRVLELIDATDEVRDPLTESDPFTTQERREFRHWQEVDRAGLQGYVSSSSFCAVLAPDERQALLDEVGAIYDSYGRGSAGMRLPWKATCFRAVPTERSTGRDDDSDDGLLIDFA